MLQDRDRLAFFEEAPDALLLSGEDLRIRRANQQAAALYRRPAEALVGLHALDDLRTPEALAVPAEWPSLPVGAATRVRTVHRDAAGNPIPVEVAVRVIRLDGQRAYVSVVRDIRDRVGAEAEIALLTRLLRVRAEINRLIAGEPDAAHLLQEACRLIAEVGDFVLVWIGRVDAASARITPVASAGPSRDYVTGLEVRADDSPQGRGPTGTAYRERRLVAVEDTELDPRVGPWRERMARHGLRSSAAAPILADERFHGVLTLYSRAVASFGGEVGRVISGVADDLAVALLRRAERQQLEAALLQSQKMEAVGRLAGGVAHDFNNLLTVVLGNVAELRCSLPTGSPLVTALDEIDAAAQRGATLTRQLLAFSRQQVLQPRRVDVNAAVLTVLPLLRRLVGESIVLRTLLAEGLGRVLIDQGQFEQVLFNLFANARDAMPGGGNITVRTEALVLDAPAARALDCAEPGAYVCITVEDTGLGMEPEVLAHVFEPFYTTKEQGKGTGLGLATVYGIVRQSRGGVEVSSDIGQGTAFRIYLPVAPGGKEAAPASA